MNAPQESSNKPVASFSRRGVSVSVFANPVDGRDIPRYRAAIQKTYMKDGEFKTTTSFSTEDLPVLQLLLHEAYERILTLEDEKKKASRQTADGSTDESDE